MQQMRVIAFVHAKGSSERVPSKNLKILGDRPLFCHAISNALSAKLISSVVIDSDSEEILRIGAEAGAIPLPRSAELATNATSGDDLAYWQASNYPDSDLVLQVIPTSPFIKPESIDRAIQTLIDERVNSVVGVSKDAFYEWKDGRPAYHDANGRIPNSSELKPLVFETTGLYVNRTESVLKNRKRVNLDSCRPFFLSRIEAIDINLPEDFQFAEIVWRGLQRNLERSQNPGAAGPPILHLKAHLLVIDVDGVMTDGGMYYTDSGSEIRKFNVRDGVSIVRAIRQGIQVAFLSNGANEAIVRSRAKTLGVQMFYVGNDKKEDVLERWRAELGLEYANIAFIGDDTGDIGVIDKVGLSACPRNASEEVRARVTVVLDRNGGDACVREFVDKYLICEAIGNA